MIVIYIFALMVVSFAQGVIVGGQLARQRLAAQGTTPTRRAETTGSVGEADGGPVA